MKALPSAGNDERSENIIIALTMIVVWAVV